MSSVYTFCSRTTTSASAEPHQLNFWRTFCWHAQFLPGYCVHGIEHECVMLCRCLGITLSFHRQLSHRSFQTPKWVEYALAYCGVLAVQVRSQLSIAVHGSTCPEIGSCNPHSAAAPLLNPTCEALHVTLRIIRGT